MESWNTPLRIEELTPELLIRLYANGLFPMAESREDRTVFLVSPMKRGLLPLDSPHVPRRLRKTILRTDLKIRCDTDFRGVMELCAEAAGNRPETWINDIILDGYCELFDMGLAHSVEVWSPGGKLVGGVYGVALGGAFFGESMVSRVRDASKIALVNLIARLRLGGYTLLDTQFATNHLKQFGAFEISVKDYLIALEKALDHNATFPVQADKTEELRALKEVFTLSPVKRTQAP